MCHNAISTYMNSILNLPIIHFTDEGTDYTREAKSLPKIIKPENDRIGIYSQVSWHPYTLNHQVTLPKQWITKLYIVIVIVI